MFTVTRFAGTSPRGGRVSLDGLEKLAEFITKNDWSTATFRSDYRNIANFESMDLLGLDVDGGMTLSAAQQQFAQYACVIATTKNHQRVKHAGEPSEQPACDRFRVVFQLSRPIKTDAEYKRVFAGLEQLVPAIDRSTKNADRFWYACRDVVFRNTTGVPLNVDEVAAAAPLESSVPSTLPTATIVAPGQKGSLSKAVYRFLAEGAPLGEWNRALFKAAKDIQQQGYTLSDALEMLERPARLPGNKGHLDETDVATIDSAFKNEPRHPARPEPLTGNGRKKMGFADLCDWVRAQPGKIEMDERSGEIYLNRTLLQLDLHALDVREELSRFGSWVAKEDVVDAHLHVANENRFNPVTEYLCALTWDGKRRLGTVPVDVLGLEASPLYASYLTKWATSAVARAFRPGCKVDTVLVLQGVQSCGKSTFVKTMAGEWFTDSALNLENKDSYLALSRNWIIEWPELDSLARTRNQSTIKAFISSAEDQYRKPYGKDISVVKRSSVFVGTTNDAEFLADETGSRRFMVIAGLKDIRAIDEKLRDQLWAEAVEVFRSGAPWHLTPAEERMQADVNAIHRPQDAWFDDIRAYVSKLSVAIVTISEILDKCLGLAVKDRGHAQKLRASSCLRELGWEPRKTNGNRVWVRSNGV